MVWFITVIEKELQREVSFVHCYSILNCSEYLNKTFGPILFFQNTSLPHSWPSIHIKIDGKVQKKILSKEQMVSINDNTDVGLIIDQSYDRIDLI